MLNHVNGNERIYTQRYFVAFGKIVNVRFPMEGHILSFFDNFFRLELGLCLFTFLWLSKTSPENF